jgi:hypothetical protein
MTSEFLSVCPPENVSFCPFNKTLKMLSKSKDGAKELKIQAKFFARLRRTSQKVL